MELYNNIAQVLSKRGINLVVGDIYDHQQIWKSWYRGNVADFHFYNEIVNGQTVLKERLTMNMAKKNCEDIAKLLWTEKTQIELDNEESTKRLWDILESNENNFTVNFPIFLEKGCAIGTGALIEYKNVQDKTIIDYVMGDVIIPYKYTNSYINGIVTISRFKEESRKKEWIYTHITYHEYEDGKYRILNELYRSESETELGRKIDFAVKFPDIKESDEIETDAPRFQIFKPNLANNLDTDSPMGISIFANSIDRYKSIDMKYDSFYREFKLGKKRILVDPTAMKATMQADEDGNVRHVQYFDSNDEAYVGINGMEGQPVKDIDMSLRTEEHIKAINTDLNWLSSNIGLGNNFYKFDDGGLKTATEVMSENADAFRTKVHYDIIVNDVIENLVKVICEMESIPYTRITIIPDDSIIEDKNTERVRALQEVGQGLRSKKSYLTDIEGMTDEEADIELQNIQDEKITNQEAFGFISEE